MHAVANDSADHVPFEVTLTIGRKSKTRHCTRRHEFPFVDAMSKAEAATDVYPRPVIDGLGDDGDRRRRGFDDATGEGGRGCRDKGNSGSGKEFGYTLHYFPQCTRCFV
ncbi:hypothetical protein roselon_02874 [Roseibacterium elongatum DSM 19469]|uniref:Uncharacterized protein n=1 Tax=Roseicyclus elongatus DSM 19469 TaxID=1294273 RepID=W8SRK5_9RHOB|nr:hypothetical protein roselon_02874 [Roseibacterium elongatum DSM 19469]